jgi:hypothetical protein
VAAGFIGEMSHNTLSSAQQLVPRNVESGGHGILAMYEQREFALAA